ncbi:hypothetical protein H1P_500021 [Hyella patelloides LEGE 07179]|uniref:Uncharacterized protein n=1 Tax=Hyella patelloides LEGE 07179 TaxID=945734 RepID=A0A563VZL4_9CYAN|nr:hypothetical protein H1P_500021 [Hyella patelloides LEGE 07179]
MDNIRRNWQIVHQNLINTTDIFILARPNKGKKYLLLEIRNNK